MGRKARKTERRRVEIEFLKDKFVGRNAKPGCHEFILVLDNLKPNFNMGKIFRSAFVFGAHEIHVIGTKYFDTKPAKGALKYIPTKFFHSHEESLADLRTRGYQIFVFDMNGEARLGTVDLPRKSAFLVGNEGLGITFDYANEGVTILSIPQFSQMESLNVSIAASIAMYEYIRQYGMGVTKPGVSYVPPQAHP